MYHQDWDSVLHFVSEPLDMDFGHSDSPVVERAELSGSAILSPSQVPTPPDSHDGSPFESESWEGSTVVSVSTTFYPGSKNGPTPPDVVLLSSDSVFFYVHSSTLLGASENNFKSLLPASQSKYKDHASPIITVSETSTVLNVVLHTIYDMSCVHYSPSFEDLASAVTTLDNYGVAPRAYISPLKPLYTILLSHAPLYPLELYALASKYDLYDLAATTSSHLLSFPLANLTDEMAERMGAVYLRRLFFLHFGRSDALKRLLLSPPHPHAPTVWCDFTEQKKLTRAWALASAYLAWDARPDLSTSSMESALNPLAEHLSCDLCRCALRDRVRNLVVQWSVVKRTI